MQKQIVIASLLGSAAATVIADQPCTDMVTKVWTSKSATLAGMTAGLKTASDEAAKAETAGLTPNKAAIKALTDYKAAVAKIVSNYTTITALQTSTKKDIATQIGISTASDKAISTKTGLVTSAQKAYDAVYGPASTTERAKQTAVRDAYAAALAMHNTEKVVLVSIATRAAATHTAAEVLGTHLKAMVVEFKLIVEYPMNKTWAAKGTYDALNTAYSKVGTGAGDAASWAKAEKLAIADSEAKITAYWTAYTNKVQALDMKAKVATACALTTDCKTLVNTDADQLMGAGKQQDVLDVFSKKWIALEANLIGAPLTNYEGVIKAYGEKLAIGAAKLAEKDGAKVMYDGYVDAKSKAVLKLQTDQDDKTKAALALKTTADTNVTDFDNYTKNFATDKARAEKDLLAVTKKSEPLMAALIIAKYNLQTEKDTKAQAVAAQAKAQAVLDSRVGQYTSNAGAVVNTSFDTLVTEAKGNYDRVNKKIVFYTQAQTVAGTVQAALKAKATECLRVYNANLADVKAAKASLAAAVAVCKTNNYIVAQNARNDLDKKTAKDGEVNKTLKVSYAKKVAGSQKAAATGVDAAKSNTDNVICAYPAKAADGAQAARPICAEKYCCGSAQRFMKDGTKMSVETCQKKESHQYTYYPPLPTGATVAPMAQTWRFQCISGAQKLVAAATGILAASYMM